MKQQLQHFFHGIKIIRLFPAMLSLTLLILLIHPVSTYSQANPFSCSDYFGQPNVHLISPSAPYNNGSATGILAEFGLLPGNPVTTTDHILIDGNIIIDQDLSFVNCPNIHMMPNADIQLNNSTTLRIQNSSLMAECDYWKGIIADHSTEKIIIEQGSNLSGMIEGVRLLLNGGSVGMLHCSNSTFTGNRFSIRFGNTPPAYAGFVTNCGFYDFQVPAFSFSAVDARDCQFLNIGSASAGGNYFYGVGSGIWIYGTVTNNFMQTNLINNKFENIHGGDQINVTPNTGFYDLASGCAVFARNQWNMANNMEINIINTNSGTHIKNADKGVVTTGVNANISDMNVKDVKAVFMNANTDGHKYNILNNHIINPHIGISFTGNDLGGSLVENNTIDMASALYFSFPAAWPFTAYGILLNRTTVNNNAFMIRDNIINFNFKNYQRGISILNAGQNVTVRENEVNMPFGVASSTTWAPNVQNQNRGIFAINSNTSLLRANVVRMNGDWGIGMQITSNNNLRILCNDIEAAYGLRVEGSNMTFFDRVLNNRFAGFSSGGFGIYLVNFASLAGFDGRVGDIGNITSDMNNYFTGGMVATQKVYKDHPVSCFQYNIYTDPINLTAANCSSLVFNCLYMAQSNLGATQYYCTPPLNITANKIIPDTTYSESVARGLAVFPDFQQVTMQMEQQELFETLATDSLTSSGNAILDSFYTASLSTDRYKLYLVKEILQYWLADSLLSTDSTSRVLYIDSINTINNSISDTSVGVQQEKLMTTLYLRILKYGTDSLSTIQKDTIAYLANACPFIYGRAIYMARALHTLFAPGMLYDDKINCDGSYKNGDAYHEENKAREAQEEQIRKLLSLQGRISVYPNPASSLLSIDYSLAKGQNGTFTLYDMTGKEMMSSLLSPDNHKINLYIQNLAKGIYIYKYIKDGRVSDTGKVIKE